jgi:hypothetical protein
VNSKRLQLNDEEKMHAICSLSNELTHLIENSEATEDWREKAVKIWRQYTPQLNLKDKDLVSLADQAKEDLIDLNSILNIGMSKSSIIQGLDNDKEPTNKALKNQDTLVLQGKDLNAKSGDAEQTLVINPVQRSEQKEKNTESKEAEVVLKAGIDKISAMLTADYSVTEIFRLCLEIMNEAFQFDHAVVCMINHKKKIMEGKFGHGINNEFLSQFQFSMKYKPDVFHLALDKGADIFIDDTRDDKIVKKIPAWHQQIIDAETFIVLPVMVKKKAIGLFYGDRFKSGELNIKTNELKLMQKLKFLASEALIKKYKN